MGMRHAPRPIWREPRERVAMKSPRPCAGERRCPGRLSQLITVKPGARRPSRDSRRRGPAGRAPSRGVVAPSRSATHIAGCPSRARRSKPDVVISLFRHRHRDGRQPTAWPAPATASSAPVGSATSTLFTIAPITPRLRARRPVSTCGYRDESCGASKLARRGGQQIDPDHAPGAQSRLEHIVGVFGLMAAVKAPTPICAIPI